MRAHRARPSNHCAQICSKSNFINYFCKKILYTPRRKISRTTSKIVMEARPIPNGIAENDLAFVEAGLRRACGDGDGTQLEAARKLRELLSTNREALIQHVLECNWVPLLLNWLQLYQKPAVQVILEHFGIGKTRSANFTHLCDRDCFMVRCN